MDTSRHQNDRAANVAGADARSATDGRARPRIDRRTASLIGGIVLAGIVLVSVILLIGRRGSSGGEVAAAEAPEYPRGPHEARLLSDSTLQMEMTIYETGVPPRFRIYPYDDKLKPIAPKDVELRVELHRLGGRIDRVSFKPEADYLASDQEIEEPHSFDVKVFAQYKGQGHQWSYAQIEGKVQLGAAQVKSAGIVIDTVRPRVMVTALELPGEVKVDETRLAHVVPQLKGMVTEVRKKEGDQVRQGEVMAVLSSRELAQARSAYLAAQHEVEFARITFQREEGLWKKKISAERDYLEAKRELDEAVLAERLAAQTLVALGVPSSALRGMASAPAQSMSRYEIRAPLSGEVIARNITVGESVNGEEEIFTVANLSSLWVDVTVYAKDIGAVRAGQTAMVTSTDLKSTTSERVSYVGPLVGEDTRAATARIVMPNRGGRWRPGLFVTVSLVRQSSAVPIAVASEAIQTFRDWQVVFVRHGDWFEARPLELGRTDGKWVEVLKGLSVGDQYASTNSFAVKAEIGKLGATHDH